MNAPRKATQGRRARQGQLTESPGVEKTPGRSARQGGSRRQYILEARRSPAGHRLECHEVKSGGVLGHLLGLIIRRSLVTRLTWLPWTVRTSAQLQWVMEGAELEAAHADRVFGTCGSGRSVVLCPQPAGGRAMGALLASPPSHRRLLTTPSLLRTKQHPRCQGL